MHLEMLLMHLGQAERHVADGARLLKRERATVRQRRRAGRDIAEAERLLQTMEEIQLLHVAHVQRLYWELAQLD